MTAPPSPGLGQVVWAEVADANGKRKRRPAVVVSASADISAGQPVRLAAITTRLPVPLPADHVLLPWDRQGRTRTGLRQRCAAVASWLVEVHVADIQDIVGHLPPAVLPPAVLTELVDKVAAFLAPPASPSKQP